jgi:hypothetical protein
VINKKTPRKRATPAAPLLIRNPPPTAETEASSRKSNSDFLTRIAAKLEARETLTALESDFAAGALRGMAVRILVETSGRSEGRPSELDPGTTAIEFALLLKAQLVRGEKLNQSKAISTVAEKYEVTDKTVRNRMAPMLAAALKFAGVKLPVRKKRLGVSS